jgi:hypothetical protein
MGLYAESAAVRDRAQRAFPGDRDLRALVEQWRLLLKDGRGQSNPENMNPGRQV